MISYSTFYFWVFILGCMLIVFVTYNLGRARKEALLIELADLFEEMEVEDIEK